jgi:hypothetical protein
VKDPVTGIWDITFGNGKGNFLYGQEAVGQAVRTRLLLFEGEWFLDITDGLPMFQSILGYQGSNKEAVDRLITERILGTTGITQIVSFTSSYDSSIREYTYTAIADSIYGPVVVSNSPLDITE